MIGNLSLPGRLSEEVGQIIVICSPGHHSDPYLCHRSEPDHRASSCERGGPYRHPRSVSSMIPSPRGFVSQRNIYAAAS